MKYQVGTQVRSRRTTLGSNGGGVFAITTGTEAEIAEYSNPVPGYCRVRTVDGIEYETLEDAWELIALVDPFADTQKIGLVDLPVCTCDWSRPNAFWGGCTCGAAATEKRVKNAIQ